MYLPRPFLGAGFALFLTACSSASPDGGEFAARGFAVADEPYAARAGVSVLTEGGSAADAATAMYFTLAVTYPVAAGLGGGGLCTVYDSASRRSEVFQFLPRDARGGGAFSVPGSVKGFVALQGAYGRLPWQRDVSYGEELATAGFPMSEALAARVAAAQDVIRLDAALAGEFLDESGKAKTAGTRASSAELGQTLSTIRTQGALGFYRGGIADKLAAYSAAQGGGLTLDELDLYSVVRASPQTASVGSLTVFLPPQDTGAGAYEAALLSEVQGTSPDLLASNGAHVVAQATAKALDKFKIASLPQDLGATGFAAVDRSGQAVACAVTMNGAFGSGRTAEGTGVVLARAPSMGQGGLSAAFLTPVTAVAGGTLALAGAGAGGPNGTASMVYALLRNSGEPVSGVPDVRTTGTAPYETANVIVCQSGSCQTVADPGGHGLGLSTAK